MHRTALAIPAARVDTRAAAGTGFLEVARTGLRSVVRRAFATSPLKLLTPRGPAGAAWIYTSTYGGGLVDGDSIQLTADIGPDATAWLSTQSSTKVYRSPRGTSVRLDARVGERGVLVVAPDPVVCFAGSTYRQSQHVDLHPTASLVLLDWLSSGRRAFGERWQFDRFTSRTTVCHDGRLLFMDGLDLSGRDGDLTIRMGRFDVVAAVVLAGQGLRSHADRMVAAVSGTAVPRCADVLLSASRLGEWGCVLRVAGTTIEMVSAVVREQLRFVPALVGDDPWGRKW